jgi:hypothetical protein
MQNYTFSCEPLQNAFDEAKNVFNNIHAQKNAISNDIKHLEAFLSSVKINEDFKFDITQSDDFCREPGKTFLHKNYLQWEVSSKRLIYIRESALAFDNLEILCPIEDFNVVICKPLLETPFEIREAVHPHLAIFLSEITKLYS